MSAGSIVSRSGWPSLGRGVRTRLMGVGHARLVSTGDAARLALRFANSAACTSVVGGRGGCTCTAEPGALIVAGFAVATARAAPAVRTTVGTLPAAGVTRLTGVGSRLPLGTEDQSTVCCDVSTAGGRGRLAS